MQNVWTLFSGWWQKPFDPEGDVFNWFLFVGLIIVLFFLWGRIVNKIA